MFQIKNLVTPNTGNRSSISSIDVIKTFHDVKLLSVHCNQYISKYTNNNDKNLESNIQFFQKLEDLQNLLGALFGNSSLTNFFYFQIEQFEVKKLNLTMGVNYNRNIIQCHS